jgi:hypothetical protein
MSDKDFEILNANVRHVMGTKAGRDVMWEILSMCQLGTDNSADANQGIEGKRSIGLQIIGLLSDADPKLYPNLLISKQEDEDERRTNNGN